MLQPSTVHLCISRRCTAEKWIFKAPLSQKVFRQTLHCTRFFPVAGFINWVPRFKGMLDDPQCRLVGVDDFLPTILLECLCDFVISLSRLKFKTLWDISSDSSSSSEGNSTLFAVDDRYSDDLLDVRLGKDDATSVAAANEFTETAAAIAAAEWFKLETGGGGNGGKHDGTEDVGKLRFNPMLDSLSEVLLLGSGVTFDWNPLRPLLNFRKSNGCIF